MILEFSNDEEDDYFTCFTTLPTGSNGRCRGQLIIIHSKSGDSESDLKTRSFLPSNYKNTKKVFRNRGIIKVVVAGTCTWNLHSRKRFQGQNFIATPGFNSHVPFVPFSISQP